jgi:hypothetical protein
MSTGTGRVEDPGVKEGGMDIDPDSSRHPELHKKSNEEAMQRERDRTSAFTFPYCPSLA